MKRETTASYQWEGQGIIRRVDIRTQANGRAVAYVYADDSNDRQAERNVVRAALRGKGWGTLSDHSGEQFSLRVSGITDPQELIRLITEHGYVTGSATIGNTEAAAEQPKGTANYIKDHSLSISGGIATVGNAMSLASGFARLAAISGEKARNKQIGQIGQGAAFAIADLPLAIAGQRDDSRQLSNLLRQLKKHYKTEGIDIPANASIHVETSNKNKSAGELTKDYLHRYANQIKCSMEVVAAAFTIKAGFEQNSKPKKYVPLIWGSGFLASLLIPERKIDDEKYEKAGFLERAWMKIQSNPLSIGGLLGYSNTVATYASAHGEYKASRAPGGNGSNLYRWDVAIPTVMIGANGTYAISKKTVGGDIKNNEMVSDIYSIAAQIINKQPDDLRASTIESTAKFLGQRTEIRDTHSQIIERLQKEVLIQRQNPWFENTRLAIRAADGKTQLAQIAPAATEAHLDANETAAPVPTTAISTADSTYQSKLAQHASEQAPHAVAAL